MIARVCVFLSGNFERARLRRVPIDDLLDGCGWFAVRFAVFLCVCVFLSSFVLCVSCAVFNVLFHFGMVFPSCQYFLDVLFLVSLVFLILVLLSFLMFSVCFDLLSSSVFFLLS